jgi:DNA transformation protein and related proteins
LKNEDTSFVDFIDDQLDGLDIKAVRMFGSYGLYKGDAFFGIIADSQLFLKTSGKTKEKYIARGMMPFAPSKLQIMPNYLQVPADVLENREILKIWALEAAACEGQ